MICKAKEINQYPGKTDLCYFEGEKILQIKCHIPKIVDSLGAVQETVYVNSIKNRKKINDISKHKAQDITPKNFKQKNSVDGDNPHIWEGYQVQSVPG